MNKMPNEQMLNRINTLVNMYCEGTPWELDDETRNAIIDIINVNAISIDRSGFGEVNLPKYCGIRIPATINSIIESKQEIFKYPNVKAPNTAVESRVGNEQTINDKLYTIKRLEAKLRTAKLIESIENRDFKYLTDELLMNLIWIHLRYSNPEYLSLTKPMWFTDAVKRDLYEHSIPKSARNLFDFSKELKIAEDEARTKDSSAEAQNAGESISK